MAEKAPPRIAAAEQANRLLHEPLSWRYTIAVGFFAVTCAILALATAVRGLRNSNQGEVG